MILLYIQHSAEEPVNKYVAALRRRGVEAEVHAFIAPGLPGVPGGGLSARYDVHAHSGKGSPLGALLRDEHPAMPLQSYDAVYVACWSSGYGWARHLSDGDLGMLSGLFLIDSGHTSLDPDNTASDAGVQWAVKIACDAKQGRRLFWIGHTDVPTGNYGQKGAYASTTKFAAEVVRLAGGQGGLFHVRAYDLRKGDHAGEHRDSLNVWGPEFVAEGIAKHMKREKASIEIENEDTSDRSETKTGPDRSETKTGGLADRLAAWVEREIQAGTQEQPLGSNSGARVDEFFTAPFTRDDPNTPQVDNKPIKVGRTEWCAAMIGFALHELTGEGRPFELRVSGIELEIDARKRGDFIERGKGHPQRGDIMITKRAVTNKPSEAWKRHVCVVLEAPTDSNLFVTGGGNENHRVKRTNRDLQNPEIVGFIRLR